MAKKYTLLIGITILSMTMVYSQTLSKDELQYLKMNAFNIDVDSTYSNGNWEPFLNQVRDKRIVLLGEFNHGSKEVFVSRNDLIKSLYENLGFDVILFEAGIGELAVIDLYREKMSEANMTLGFFGIWRTIEFRDLMRFVKRNNISVSGFDVQRSGGNFERFLEIVASSINIDSTNYSNLEKRFTNINRKLKNRKTSFDSVQPSTIALIKDYQNIKRLLQENKALRNDKALLLSHKTLSNRIAYLKYRLEFVKDKDWNKRWESRDSAMASNIEWLIDNFYNNRKIIIIGHNYHISRFNEKEEVMGEFLKKKFGSEMYAVGVFAGKGSYFGNSGNANEIIQPDFEHLDIKHIIIGIEGHINFIDIPYKSTTGSKWLFNEILINDTFIDLSGSNSLILSKHFDGLLMIDKVSPPEMIKWN